MKNKNVLEKKKYLNMPINFNKPNNKTNICYINKNYIIILLSFCVCFFPFCAYKLSKNSCQNITSDSINLSSQNINNDNNDLKLGEKIYYDTYEVYKYNEIKNKLMSIGCSQMWANQREFLNGIVRKFKPKKILEIGVNAGGSSIVILNAINDFKDSHLFSIELNSAEIVGECANKHFPELTKKWTLFKGNIATEFIEQIGNDIDMVFIDTSHVEPGEILDFIIVLPFLKENAIALFHDIANQITVANSRNEYAPYIIFNAIRGEKYLPSGPGILTKDIGAIRLDSNQKKYYHDYFRLLGGQWQYFPKEAHIEQVKRHFKKYYDNDCLTMFEEAVSFNRKFVQKNKQKFLPSHTYDK